jgi:hypothetical protein
MAVVTIEEQSVPDETLYVTTNLHRSPAWFGDLIVADADEMALIGAGDYGAIYSGSFVYDRNGKASGTVSSFEFLLGAAQGESGGFDGDTQFTITGINDPDGFSARRLQEYATSGDGTAALQFMLSKADVIYGTGFSEYSIDEILYGWGGKDRIFGVDGHDVLGGGLGKDTLAGGNGQDYFFLDSAKAKNADMILDFGFGNTRDKIVLLQSEFTGLALGSLSADQFVIGAAAADADDRILLDGHKLRYDADGSGIGKAVMIAKVFYAEVVPVGITQLTADDFLIVDSIENIVPLVPV